ncbi:MAG: cupredoxin domain-containing protein [Deltaproteobacteria bacterium]|nr:cupredoxin domain-containing protein [Deltaproteobacteria bacterium]
MSMRLVLWSLTLVVVGATAVAAKPRKPTPARPVPTKPAPAKPAPIPPPPPPPMPVPAPPARPASTRVEIIVTPRGFEPARIVIKRGQPMVLAFTRKTEATCAKSVVIDMGDGTKVTKDLPLDQTVEIAATFAKAGELRYACGMDMVHGVLVVQ